MSLSPHISKSAHPQVPTVPLLVIGVQALSDLGGSDFLARKIYAIPECVIVEIRIQTHSNRTQLPHLLKPCGRRFLWEFNFADFGFFRFREKNFRDFHVQYFKVTKNGSHLVVFVTLFATNNYCIEVQQCKKAGSKFLRDFCWREFVFTGFYCAFQ